MERFLGRLLSALALSVLVMGCGGGTDSRPKAAETLYDVKGKVVAVDPKKPSVTLDHEDIPGAMKAMTMEFPVADAKVLDGIQVGNAVRGQLKKGESGYVVTRLEKQ
jgi:Cu/Ag efflux protein CusF